MKYRIRRDLYCGYEVLFWRWYWPFWKNDGCNTFSTLEAARHYAINHGTIESGEVR